MDVVISYIFSGFLYKEQDNFTVKESHSLSMHSQYIFLMSNPTKLFYQFKACFASKIQGRLK